MIPSTTSPASSSNPPRQGPPPNGASTSKVARKRSLTKPERHRPKPGMINQTLAQKNHDANFQERNDSTGNLIQSQSTGDALTSSAAATAAQEQQQQRLRIQQANQAKNQAKSQSQQRPRPRRLSTLRRAGSKGQLNNSNSQAPQRRSSTMAKAKKKLAEREIELTAWVVVSRIFTCCMPSSLLRCCNHKKFSRIQVIQAWREKVTLCIIIGLICGLLAFIIFGLQPTMCPNDSGAVKSYSTQPTDGSRPVKGWC
ncbi:hypothetical protein BC939DRAFT_476076 [Gamsiella multidivaricata]|uniref:uncharacterized protein n=1 Tax=Gamsiella multidivaricata TaxID=101098 RepID=UPI002220410C|nr:uncharacterized protein BC939DRAFT_476076 [Gamsiella multidivaricata]KAI7825626.1 hypothetical protein BC939DRAFT_476076 [Gamsiella multidivaricata]